MNILSWNVAGIRALLKKDNFHNLINENDYSIICLQETKAEEQQVILTEEIVKKYPYRYWNSSDGTSQRKGLSGTTIWCKYQPIKVLETPEFDNEGRIIAIELDKFILINVYVPNSQKLDSDRYNFRSEWNTKFLEYLLKLKEKKYIVLCGDMNVAHLDIDISNPKSKKNKVAGFFDNERLDFAYMIENLYLIDIFRFRNPLKQKSTYWSNFLKAERKSTNGWRIDYFLISKELLESDLKISENICSNILGSDHCPINLNIEL